MLEDTAVYSFKWINREPFKCVDSEEVCTWLLQLEGKAWRTQERKDENPDDPDAIAYESEVINLPENKYELLSEWAPLKIETMSDLYRKFNKWDSKLERALLKELKSPRAIENWDGLALSIATP